MKTVFLLPLLLILWSCSGKHGDSGKTVFRYNESAGISSLDPAFARNQANIWVVNQLFNSLVQLDTDLRVIPCIARSWSIAGDGREYTFRLRDDVYFHDDPLFISGRGRRLTAADVAFSLRRILDPSLASPGAWVLNKVDSINGQPAIRAVDDTTLLIRIREAFPPFLGLLSMQYCSVIPREVADHYGKDFRKHPVGTGPFRLGQWKEGVKLVLLKNENYFETDHGKRLPFLDAVSVTFIVDKQSVFLEFIKGKLDFMSGIDASYKDELLTRSGKLNPKYKGKIQMTTMPYLNTEYLGILLDPDNEIVKNSPLRLKAVRLAISHGFDRRKMMRYLRNNIGTPGLYGMIPPGLPSFDTAGMRGYSYDPGKAAALLEEAGFPGGRGLPEITLSTNSSYLDLSTYIQQQLTELGMKVKLDVHQPASMREMVAQAKLKLFRASWIADYPDAENYLSLFYSPNFTPFGPNYTRFKNEDFDRMYRQSQLELNDSLRFRLYSRMDSLVMSEAPVIILYYDQVLRFSGKDISGLGSNAMNLLNLKKVKKIKPYVKG